jgi:hypothetical protein
MDAICIPVGEPLTFERLRELNPAATADDLAEVFPHLPAELKAQAWEAMRLRVALDAWGDDGSEAAQT